jgi:hypothetical protein
VKHLERKQRTSRLIRTGSNAWIAGVSDIDPVVLKGALVCTRPLVTDPAWSRVWRKAGEIAITDWEEGGEKRMRAAAFKKAHGGDTGKATKVRQRLLIAVGGVIAAAGWAEENPAVLVGHCWWSGKA